MKNIFKKSSNIKSLLIGIGIGLGVILLFYGLWTSGMIKIKTPSNSPYEDNYSASSSPQIVTPNTQDSPQGGSCCSDGGTKGSCSGACGICGK